MAFICQSFHWPFSDVWSVMGCFFNNCGFMDGVSKPNCRGFLLLVLQKPLWMPYTYRPLLHVIIQVILA